MGIQTPGKVQSITHSCSEAVQVNQKLNKKLYLAYQRPCSKPNPFSYSSINQLAKTGEFKEGKSAGTE